MERIVWVNLCILARSLKEKMCCANSLWRFVVRFFVVLKRKQLLSEVFSCSQYFSLISVL